MKKILLSFIFGVSIMLTGGHRAFATLAGDNILISEVEYNPSHIDVDQLYEWFELYNPTISNIDISGWQFTDGEGTPVIIPNGNTINSGDYFLAVYNTVDFNTEHAGITPDLEYGSLANASDVSLANGGDELTIMDDTAAIIDETGWENHVPLSWAIYTTEGESIARSTSTDTDTVADWIDHQTPTPGTGSLTVLNLPPTNIQINGGGDFSINEEITTGTSIGTLTTTDPNIGDTHTYTLVAGSGDEDNGKFQITGDQLELNFTPDYENPIDLGNNSGDNTYTLRIQTDDGNGGTYQTDFIIAVNDIAESTPSSTSSIRRSSGSGRVSKAKLAEIFGKAEVKKDEVKKNEKNKCSFIYLRLIHFGTHGEDVRALQVTLNALGFNTGIGDGWYGPKTEAGIKAFQTAMGISNDGIFGPQSHGKLSLKCFA